MKIVIDIDNETYARIQALVNADYFEHDICGYSMQRIANGTPYEERPHGEWKGNNFGEHSCPLCGHPALYEEEPDGYYEVQSDFCPNCGVDMRGRII